VFLEAVNTLDVSRQITPIQYHQQSEDAKKPYLVQYYVVFEDSPVRTSWISKINNILIKTIPKPPKTHFMHL
jgi:hypothetical protein